MRALPLHRRFLPFFLPVLFSRGVGLSSLSVPSSPHFPSSDPAPRQSPAAGARPLPAGSRGWEPFAPAVSGHLLTSSSLRETWSSLPFLSFTARVESLGLAPRESPAFNFAEGGGLDVDTVKLLLLAQSNVSKRVGRQFPETHTFPPFFLWL